MGNLKFKPEFNSPWRKTIWGKVTKDNLMKGIKGIEPCPTNLKCLRVLVVGPSGSGKSSFINSVNSAFKGWINCSTLSDSIGGKIFTVEYKPIEIESGNSSLSVIFNDIMGLETGHSEGCPVEDVINAINGHVRHGHVNEAMTYSTETDPKPNQGFIWNAPFCSTQTPEPRFRCPITIYGFQDCCCCHGRNHHSNVDKYSVWINDIASHSTILI